MTESIKDRVAIIGMGCTRFGELWDKGTTDLVVEPVNEALADAGIEKKDIQAAWMSSLQSGSGGRFLSEPLKLEYVPVSHCVNACAGGHDAMRNAAYAVAAGIYDVVLVAGFEKLKDTGQSGLNAMTNTTKTMAVGTMPGFFAMMATRYFHTYGLSPQEGKTMLAKISAKSHYNGSLNPRAHLRNKVNLEAIMAAPVVAWPLGLFDSCGVSDGGAAAVLTRADLAKNFRKDPVYIKAMQVCSSPSTGRIAGAEHSHFDYSHIEECVRASEKAYNEAGIKDPRKEVSMAEVHDCFSITEAVTMEDLRFSPRGKVKEDVDSGFFELKGSLPVQPDGGLKCFGHPIGASGIRMVYELYKQLQGKAELPERQIANPKIGLAHNMGHEPLAPTVSVFIVGL